MIKYNIYYTLGINSSFIVHWLYILSFSASYGSFPSSSPFRNSQQLGIQSAWLLLVMLSVYLVLSFKIRFILYDDNGQQEQQLATVTYQDEDKMSRVWEWQTSSGSHCSNPLQNLLNGCFSILNSCADVFLSYYCSCITADRVVWVLQ